MDEPKKPVSQSASAPQAAQKPEELHKDINQILAGDSGLDKDITKPKKSRTGFRIAIGAVLGLVAVIVIGIAVVAVGIYRFNWHDQFSKSIATTLHLPVALIGMEPVSYSMYQTDLATLNFFYDAQAKSDTTGASAKPTDTYLEKSVISRLIREKFVADAAATNKLTVNQTEIDSEFEAIVQQAGSVDEVTKALDQLYNWDAATFKRKVLEPYLYRTKLQEYIATDATINAEAKKKAEDVLALINKGDKTFEDIAKENSEDTTASSGGDLGFFGAGEMVAPFEEATKILKVGEVSGLVQTQYGYHIIKLIDHTDATADKAEQWHAEHILIKSKDLDEWINQQLGEKGVKILLAGMQWKKDCGLVLATKETCDNNEILTASSADTIEDTNIDADTNVNADTNANTNAADANTNSADTSN
ncbi:MAG: peptidylprolyl isomerase [Patescibacteria group bacterium]